MNDNNPAPKRSSASVAALAVIGLFGLLLLGGCAKRQSFTLHYEPARAGAPQGKVFFPARIAIAPAIVPLELNLGGVFNPQGYRSVHFEVPDLGIQVARVLASALADAGLDPVMIGAAVDPHNLPVGIDFVVSEEVRQLQYVNYGGDLNGIVDAGVELGVTLAGRGNESRNITVMAGLNRGPGSLTRATFGSAGLGPDQVLSVVVSSAFVKLLADPDFTRMLPLRDVAATVPAAPVATQPEFPTPKPRAIPAPQPLRRRYYTERHPTAPPPDQDDEADDVDSSDQNWSEVEAAPPPPPRFPLDLGSHPGVTVAAPLPPVAAPDASASEEPVPIGPSETPAPGTQYPPITTPAPGQPGSDVAGP